MFAHHIAYLHENGDIEEFLGSGLSLSSALQNGVYAAKAAVSIRRETFTLARIIDGFTTKAATERAGINAKIETHRYISVLL
jgi:hypothetical protein